MKIKDKIIYKKYMGTMVIVALTAIGFLFFILLCFFALITNKIGVLQSIIFIIMFSIGTIFSCYLFISKLLYYIKYFISHYEIQQSEIIHYQIEVSETLVFSFNKRSAKYIPRFYLYVNFGCKTIKSCDFTIESGVIEEAYYTNPGKINKEIEDLKQPILKSINENYAVYLATDKKGNEILIIKQK